MESLVGYLYFLRFLIHVHHCPLEWKYLFYVLVREIFSLRSRLSCTSHSLLKIAICALSLLYSVILFTCFNFHISHCDIWSNNLLFKSGTVCSYIDCSCNFKCVLWVFLLYLHAMNGRFAWDILKMKKTLEWIGCVELSLFVVYLDSLESYF